MISSALRRVGSVAQVVSQQTTRQAIRGLATKTIDVTYILQDGEKKLVKAPVGENLLNVAHDNDIDLEGACECSLACSTCHVYVHDPYFDQLEEPTDEENDMLDLAFALTERSRLGCQIIAEESLDGLTVELPSGTRNLQVEKL